MGREIAISETKWQFSFPIYEPKQVARVSEELKQEAEDDTNADDQAKEEKKLDDRAEEQEALNEPTVYPRMQVELHELEPNQKFLVSICRKDKSAFKPLQGKAYNETLQKFMDQLKANESEEATMAEQQT